MRNFDYTGLADKLNIHDLSAYIDRINDMERQAAFLIDKLKNGLSDVDKMADVYSVMYSDILDYENIDEKTVFDMVQGGAQPDSLYEQHMAGYAYVKNIITDSYEYMSLRPAIILQMHRDLFQYTPLSGQGEFKFACAIASKSTGFSPLRPFETPIAMDTLCEQYNRAVEQNPDNALVYIACFMVDMLCIYPFSDKNDKMANLIAYLLLLKSGYSSIRYIPFEKNIFEDLDGYKQARYLSSAGWNDEKNDYSHFVKYFMDILITGYSDLLSDLSGMKI